MEVEDQLMLDKMKSQLLQAKSELIYDWLSFSLVKYLLKKNYHFMSLVAPSAKIHATYDMMTNEAPSTYDKISTPTGRWVIPQFKSFWLSMS